SHRRVEPSTSVNKNVTTPDGATTGDTLTGCHKETVSLRTSSDPAPDTRALRHGEAQRLSTPWAVSVQGHEGSGRQPGGGTKSGDVGGQPGGGLNRHCGLADAATCPHRGVLECVFRRRRARTMRKMGIAII